MVLQIYFIKYGQNECFFYKVLNQAKKLGYAESNPKSV